ncbi:MAG: fibronectin type III domain-containing protein, partial [Gammaproteobacteria bacterium]|nr:fibronectin type III domain-containing protein [Gammaproteobacteria bacterium]
MNIRAIFRCLAIGYIALIGIVFAPTVAWAAPAGLVAAYGFDEGSGTAVSDASGNSNSGTLTGATWTTEGKYGSAIVFDGVDDFVSLPNSVSLGLTSSATFSAWIFATADPADDAAIISKAGGPGNRGWQIKTSPDTGQHAYAVEVAIKKNSIVQRHSVIARQLNAWHHVAGVYDASSQTLDIYVDGVVSNGPLSGTIPTAQRNSTVRAEIGRRPDGGFYFSGRIDEVRVYERALTPAEIQADMNAPIGGGGEPDVTAPSAPSNLAATVAGAAQINLGWTASTDDVGVTGYRVERCQGAGCSDFAEVATPAGTTHSDVGLQASTSYSYRVRAVDAANNLSPYSNTASAT